MLTLDRRLGPASRRAAQSPIAWRACTAGAGLLVLLSLFLAWSYDRAPDPDVALSAWQTYGGTDVVFALLALAVALPAARPGRGPALVSLGAAVLALLALVHTYRIGEPAHGARVALLGVLAAIGAGVMRFRLERGGERLEAAVERALGVAHSLRFLLSSWVLGAVVGVVTFPLKTIGTGGGTDSSWVAALHMAVERGMDFGTQIVFTYGPLGYLTVPRLYYEDTVYPGIAYMLVVQIALGIALMTAARRAMPLVPAFAIALLGAMACGEATQVAVVAILLIACVLALRSETLPRSRWWLPLLALGGVLAAQQALVKLNSGAAVVLLVIVTAIAASPPRRRLIGAGVVVASFVAGLVVWWVALGQDLGALPDYIGNSIQIVNGYVEYSYTEEGGRQWEYWGALLCAGVLAMLLVRATADMRRVPRIGLYLLVAGYVFAWWKQGFVRHDGHSIDFFTAMLLAGIALLAHRRPHGGTIFVCLAMLFVSYLAVSKPIPWEFLRRAQGLTLLRAHRATLSDAAAAMAKDRGVLRGVEKVDEPTLALLRGHRVHVFPTETSAAWAYPEIDWKPLPDFAGYTTYTPALDKLNARALLAPDGPDRLLRTDEYSPWENPTVIRELLCDFRELHAGERWEVLGRAPSRCGAMESIGRVSVHTAQPVSVPEPRPGEAILLVIHGQELTLSERLRSLAYKPYDRGLLLDGSRPRRWAPSLAMTPTIVRVASDVDFTGKFRLDDKAKQLMPLIQNEGILSMGQQQDRAMRFEFFRMPVRGSGRLG